MNPLAGQDEHETLETLFRNVDLSFARAALLGCFHTDGPGRPPRNPLGLFRSFIVMRMKGVRSLREMTRLLDTDQRLRKLCLIKTGEAGYPRSVLSRFIRKVGESRLIKILEEKVASNHQPRILSQACALWLWLTFWMVIFFPQKTLLNLFARLNIFTAFCAFNHIFHLD